MNEPKKKKQESIKELTIGGVILLLFSPCILSAFIGASSFLFNYIVKANSYYSLQDIIILVIGFSGLLFCSYVVITRIIIIIQRIIGIIKEHRRIDKELDTTENI